ncbi:MAG: hypothetical protein Q9218_006249 [Villophora microphyllina]
MPALEKDFEYLITNTKSSPRPSQKNFCNRSCPPFQAPRALEVDTLSGSGGPVSNFSSSRYNLNCTNLQPSQPSSPGAGSYGSPATINDGGHWGGGSDVIFYPSSHSDESHMSVKVGGIVGGVVGALLGTAVLLVLIYLLYRCIKKRGSGAGGLPAAAGFMSSLRERLAWKKEVDAEKEAVGNGGRDPYASHLEE